jgi:CRISP-associated protein Cas1
VCGAGLHPSFSLFHSNASNPFGLADDLMEPFRPLVDLAVHAQDIPELSPAGKRKIIEALVGRYLADGEVRTLPDILTHVAFSLSAAVMGERDSLWLPDLRPAPQPQDG